MPEGDTLHRAAARLQVLVGQRVEVETPHPRAAGKGLADRLSGLRLEAVEAVGKNLFLHFEGGSVLRSHLRMTGRWRVERRGTTRRGRPWLVLRGTDHEAVLWNGPVLELSRGTDPYAGRLGPDVLAEPPDLHGMIRRLRGKHPGRAVGDALLDQRLVAGIGNVWRAEALWEARVSPWRPLTHVSDGELLAVLDAAHRLMRASVEGARYPRRVYRRAGRPCRHCGAVIRSRPQGEAARIAYWCPSCQPDTSARDQDACSKDLHVDPPWRSTGDPT
jgi:endonuclease-8